MTRTKGVIALEKTFHAASKKYWEGLNRQFSIEGNRKANTRVLLSVKQSEQACARVRSEGWFSIPEVFSDSLIHSLCDAVEKVCAAGWLPIYALVYDEFWMLAHHPQLIALMELLFGSKVRFRPHLWVHRITPKPGSHGWSPHIDGEMGPAKTIPGGMISLWIPLTAATLENGCMYLIPTSAELPRGDRFLRGQCKSGALVRALHRIRALPAQPGTLLGWRGDVVHWGGFASGEKQTPRISIALEYESSKSRKKAGLMPSFEQRLWFISAQVLHYHGRFETDVFSEAQKMTADLIKRRFDKECGRVFLDMKSAHV